MEGLWTIRIYFGGTGVEPDIYPLRSCTITRCVGAAGAHAQQKATVSVAQSTTSLSLKLVGRKEQTKAEIYCGAAIQFTGLIDTDWDFSEKGRNVGDVSLDLVDYSNRLKIGVFDQDVGKGQSLVRGPVNWAGYHVCDPANTSTSIIHQLLKLALDYLGLSSAITCDAARTDTIDYFRLETGDTIKSQLDELCKEFRLDYVFQPDNSIRIVSTDSEGDSQATVTDLRNTMKGSGSVYKPKALKATWRRYETRTQVQIGYTRHKSDSVNDDSAEYHNHVAWSLPDDVDGTDKELVSISDIRVRCEHPNIDGGSATITSYDLNGAEVTLERHGFCFKGKVEAWIYADITFRYNKTETFIPRPGSDEETVTLLHKHTLADVGAFLSYYDAMRRRASTTYSFQSFSKYEPSEIVTISEPVVTGISAKARIIEQVLDVNTGLYKYKAEGAGDLDLADAISKAEESEAHPIGSGDFIELSAELVEGTGVIRVNAEGTAIDHYGLTPSWTLNGTALSDTSNSISINLSSLRWDDNVVTATVTLDGETRSATYDLDTLLSAPTLAIFSGDGSVFPVGSVNATLSAVLMRSGVDVALANESAFRWTRTSTDTVADAAWNASSKAIGKRSVIITDSDLVNGKAVFTVSCTIGTNTYTSAGFSVVTVSDGQNGWSNATCQLFKRSASAPASYDGKQLNYTFATATLTGDTGSWSRTIPSGADPLYVIYASAFAASATDIVETTDWTAPAILSENGTVGQSGMSVKTVLLYQRSETAPALPTGQVTYSFDSGEISGQGAWSLDVPTTNGYPLWVTSATAASRSASDIIEPSEWSTPAIMAKDGEQGIQGEPGSWLELDVSNTGLKQGQSSEISARGSGTVTTTITANGSSEPYARLTKITPFHLGKEPILLTNLLSNTTAETVTNGGKNWPSTNNYRGVSTSFSTAISHVANHLYYCRVTYRVVSCSDGIEATSCYIDYHEILATSSTRKDLKPRLAVGGTRTVGGLLEYPKDYSSVFDPYLYFNYPSTAENTGKTATVEFSQPMHIDLTESGLVDYLALIGITSNEQIEAWCDEYLPFFTGSLTIGGSFSDDTLSAFISLLGISDEEKETWLNTFLSYPSSLLVTATDGTLTKRSTISYVEDGATGPQGPKGEPGETGSSAKDFTLYQSATYFEVSPRGVTHKMQVISITCVPLNITNPSITWSVSSAVPTQAISSDKTVLSLTVASGVALDDLTVACSVSGIGTKSITILSTPTGENGPLYLGTDWDESATTTSEGDPLESGDYYLRLSDTMVRVYSGTEWRDVSAATSTHQMMQDALSDVLKHGADVKSTSSVLYAYVGNLVAQSASIKRLRTEVITSANYAEDANGLPVAGYKLDGPRDLITSVGMKATGGVFKDISIVGGTATMMTPDNTTVFQTNTTESTGTISITIPSGNTIYSIKTVVDSMTTKPDTSMPATGALNVDSAIVNGTSYNGILHVAKGGNVSPYLDHVIQVNSDTGAIVTQDFPVSPLSSDSIVRDALGYYGIKQITVNIYGISEISVYNPASMRPGKALSIFLYSSDGSLLASKTKENGGSYIVLSYGSVIPAGSKVVAYIGDSVTYFTTWHFRTHFPGIKPVHGDDLLFFNSEPSSAANFYVHLSTYSDVPFSISKVKNKTVTVSTSSYLTAMPVADMISDMPKGSFVATDDTSSVYSSKGQTQMALKQLIVNDTSIIMTPVTGNSIELSAGDVVDNPSLTFVSMGALKGISVLNVNAISSSSQLGTASKPFANVWANNLNNVPVTDSSNQSLSVDGASSIVGAINQVNRDLGDIVAHLGFGTAYDIGETFTAPCLGVVILSGCSTSSWAVASIDSGGKEIWKIQTPSNGTWFTGQAVVGKGTTVKRHIQHGSFTFSSWQFMPFVWTE